MKKTALAVLLIMSLCILALVACNNTQTPEKTPTTHSHTFSAWTTTVVPSCLSGGTQARTCSSCGYAEYATIEALGHTVVIDSAVAATCETAGKTEGQHCSVCNTVIVAQIAIQAKGHNEVIDSAVSATCENEGKTEGKHCGVCDTVLVAQSVIQAMGHQYNDGEIVTEATCIQEGTKKFTCSVDDCQHSYTEAYALKTYTATELYEQSLKYVGEIVTYDKKGNSIALGTGFVISSDGKIVTNYHVIEEAYYADITIDNTTYDIVSVLAYDANIDLAVLKINASGLTTANICQNPVKTGETVYAMGSSKGLTNTFSQGIITQAEREIGGVIHIQHDAAISGGNSGGPLLNVYGEVIGVNKMSRVDSQNINMAVFTTEFDNLVYGNPITLADLYQAQLTPYEYLSNWVAANYTNVYSDGHLFSVEHASGNFTYAINYNSESGNLFVDVLNDNLYCSLFLNGDPTELYFYSEFDSIYTISGVINATRFTANTVLTNYQYDGPSYQKTDAVDLTQLSLDALVSFLDWFLTVNDLDVCIEDFGFLSYGQSNNGNNNSNNTNGNTDNNATKEWFINLFNAAKDSYIATLRSSKASKQDEISSLESQISSCYTAYVLECQKIKERCASMGMSNSGYQQSLLDKAKSDYESAIKPYQKQRDALNEEIANIDKEISNPTVSNILSIMVDNYDITMQQAQQYYNEYLG